VNRGTLADVDDIRRLARHQIRIVENILREWDPIGVIDDLVADGLPPNEYDDYAPHIVGLLQRGASVEQLAHHLRYCRTQAMGVAENDEADSAIARQIHAWWENERSTKRDVG
jgi:hypothetical protein